MRRGEAGSVRYVPVHVVAADERSAPAERAGVIAERLGQQVGHDENGVQQVPEPTEPVGQLHTANDTRRKYKLSAIIPKSASTAV